jgi:pyruvate/2-oxoglutarate dehydrogenase complex dihydrolipoamide acyltransferase (E2) component
MTATTYHKVRSSHPEDDAQGRVFGPGELVPNLDIDDPFNQRKIDEGIFYEVDEVDAVAAIEEASGPDITDAAAKMAAENDVDLDVVEGTGKDGRIIDVDVQKVIDEREQVAVTDESQEGDN